MRGLTGQAMREIAREGRGRTGVYSTAKKQRRPALRSDHAANRSLRVPTATYRVQLNQQFTFRNARAILPYFHALGVSDVYSSPILQAGRDSTHGYDVARFDRLNPDLGSSAEFEVFVRALQKKGMSLVLDIVPNHMGTGEDNVWWQDVLRKGQGSNYAKYFDVNWKAPGLRGRILLPVLEDQLSRILAAGKIRVVHEHGRFLVACQDMRFPLSIRSESALAAEAGRSGLRKTLQRFHSRSRLHQLLGQQNYFLASWREAGTKINFRRFFDVSELISLHMEFPQVFEATHELINEWARSGKCTGLRVDHPDGLWDPKQYFQRLVETASGKAGGKDSVASIARPYIVAEKILTGEERLPADWPVDGTTGYDFLNLANGLFVDQRNERRFQRLYAEFTGRRVGFAESAYPGKKKVLTTSLRVDVATLAQSFKVLRTTPTFSLNTIREALTEIIACFPVYRTYIAEDTRAPSPADARNIRLAVQRAVSRIQGLPRELFRSVGSTLLLKVATPRSRGVIPDPAREFVMKFQQLTGPAAAKGIEDTAFYNFHRLISLNEVGGDPGKFGVSVPEFHQHNSYISKHWPHTLLATATHDTKRGEDARARINILSEFPDEWGEAVRRWSAVNSQHKTVVDGKSAPDTNDEILFYQTLIGAWDLDPSLLRSRRGNEAETLSNFRSASLPRRLQILELKDRLVAYMLKAVREAKTHTSWTDPDPKYETAINDFVTRILKPSSNNAFLADFAEFQSRIGFFGCCNSLSQLLLKLTSPGVPDTYQGTELWDLNLVDPDNRRPVDYTLRAKRLKKLERDVRDRSKLSVARDLVRRLPDPRIKLFVLWQGLRFRATHPDLFQHGQYIPLRAIGPATAHVVAFAREWGDSTAITIAPRLCATLTGGKALPPIGPDVWQGAFLGLPKQIGAGPFRNVFTGKLIQRLRKGLERKIDVGQALEDFPVALLFHDR